MNLVCAAVCVFLFGTCNNEKEVPHVELYILINTMLGYANLNYFLLDELKRYMLYNHYNIGDFVIFNSSYL